MSQEYYWLLVVGVLVALAVIFGAREWIRMRKELARQELAALAPEDQVLDSAAQTLAELKTVVDPICAQMRQAENDLAAADANLLKCQTDGGNAGIGWPVLLGAVSHAEEQFGAAQTALDAHHARMSELQTTLTQCHERLVGQRQVRTGAARDKWSNLYSRETGMSRAMPRVPHVDWQGSLKDEALPEDVLVRAEARQAARKKAEEERNSWSSYSNCNTLHG